jgi:hypothetical protein
MLFELFYMLHYFYFRSGVVEVFVILDCGPAALLGDWSGVRRCKNYTSSLEIQLLKIKITILSRNVGHYTNSPETWYQIPE